MLSPSRRPMPDGKLPFATTNRRSLIPRPVLMSPIVAVEVATGPGCILGKAKVGNLDSNAIQALRVRSQPIQSVVHIIRESQSQCCGFVMRGKTRDCRHALYSARAAWPVLKLGTRRIDGLVNPSLCCLVPQISVHRFPDAKDLHTSGPEIYLGPGRRKMCTAAHQ